MAKGLEPKPRLSVSEWADKNRVLPQKGASEPGPWRTERTPFLKDIMDVLSKDNPTRRVVFMKSAQVGGTEAGNNWLGYIIDHAPAPTIVVQPTGQMVERWSKQRLAAMIEVTPALRARVASARTRDSGNTIEMKEFPGGVLVLASAESSSNLRSMPAKYVFCDEVDAYPEDVDGEGDPVSLAEARTKTFPRRKMLLVSTPTVKGASRIEREWEASDQRRFHVPCPECGQMQPLLWGNLRWDDDLTRVWYVCRECEYAIEEHHKPWMLAGGEWRASFPEREVAGFHINALYTPLGLGDSWLDHVHNWQARQQDPALLKVFVNTVLGECWEDRSRQLRHHDLMTRAEPYELRTVPPGCLVLTAGIDVQDNRLAVLIVGWGRAETAWVLDWLEIPGDPSRPELWAELDKHLDLPLRNAFGVDLKIQVAAVDTGGHFTHEVYDYCRQRQHKRVIAIKGMSTAGKPILGKAAKQDVNRRGQTLKGGVMLWQVGPDTAKNSITARLAGDAEADEANRRIHFAQDLPEEFYQQLTAEVFDPRRNRWVKLKNRRNEALDCFVYAYAAALHPAVRVNTKRDADWLHLEQMLQPAIPDLFAQMALPASEMATAEPRPAVPRGPEAMPARPASRQPRFKMRH